MELCPGEHESQLAATESAVHDFKVVDPHLGFSFGMASMEVREAVIVEEHDDGYPEEAADRRDTEVGLTGCWSQINAVSPIPLRAACLGRVF
jgi:hypothetical protein